MHAVAPCPRPGTSGATRASRFLSPQGYSGDAVRFIQLALCLLHTHLPWPVLHTAENHHPTLQRLSTSPQGPTGDIPEAREDVLWYPVCLRVSTAFSSFGVFFLFFFFCFEKMLAGAGFPSSHGSDDNRFVYAGELVCARPTIFSSH